VTAIDRVEAIGMGKAASPIFALPPALPLVIYAAPAPVLKPALGFIRQLWYYHGVRYGSTSAAVLFDSGTFRCLESV